MDPLKSRSLMGFRNMVDEKKMAQGTLHKNLEEVYSVHSKEPESLEGKSSTLVMEKEHHDLPGARKAGGAPSGKGDHGFKISVEEERKIDRAMVAAVSQSTLPAEAMVADNDHSEERCGFELPSSPSGWHFPVGLGLSETVHCPSVPFQGMSYYPPFQDTNSFQVTWRQWEELCDDSDHSRAPRTDSSTFDFTVMSYNILAQDLLEANSELYLHCSEDVLAWANRFPNILKELQTWEPDILCLQEVQENHFLEQLHPALIEMGYNCVYKRRTGTKTDGCAVCYHGERFVQLSVSLLEFRRHDCELLDRDNVGVVLLLQPVAPCDQGLKCRTLCVANTHLLFNPRRGDVKLAQLAMVLAEIDSMVKQCKVKGRDCEVILCGDLNSIPNMPLYQLIVTGQLYYHGLPTWMVSGQEDLSYKIHHRRLYAPLWPNSLGISDCCQYFAVGNSQPKDSGKLQYSHDFLRQLRYCRAACVRPPDLKFITGVTDNTPNPEEKHPFAIRWTTPSSTRFRNTISHELNLRSVYSPNLTGTGHSAVTTLHSERGAMVDYIFYSPCRGCSGDCDDRAKGLKLLGRLTLLSEPDLWSLRGLPNEMFPSDHLNLLAKFKLC